MDGITLSAGQGYTDRQIFDAADVDFRASFMAAQRIEAAMGNDVFPWTQYVRMVDPTQSYTDPLTQELRELWFESDPRMRESDGGIPKFETSIARQRVITRKEYDKARRESLPRLRQPTIRAAISDEIASWGRAVAFTKREQLWTILLNGDSATYGTAYDGQFFFDTDHPGVRDGSSVSQANVFDLDLDETNLNTVVAGMQDFVDQKGVSFGNKWRSSSMLTAQTDREREQGVIQPSFHLIVGTANQQVAADLARTATSSPSAFAGTFTWETIEFFRGDFADHWMVWFPMGGQGTPLAHIDGGSTIDGKFGPDTEPGRLHNAAEWIARASWGWAYDKWGNISMSRGA